MFLFIVLISVVTWSPVWITWLHCLFSKHLTLCPAPLQPQSSSWSLHLVSLWFSCLTLPKSIYLDWYIQQPSSVPVHLSLTYGFIFKTSNIHWSSDVLIPDHSQGEAQYFNLCHLWICRQKEAFCQMCSQELVGHWLVAIAFEEIVLVPLCFFCFFKSSIIPFVLLCIQPVPRMTTSLKAITIPFRDKTNSCRLTGEFYSGFGGDSGNAITSG